MKTNMMNVAAASLAIALAFAACNKEAEPSVPEVPATEEPSVPQKAVIAAGIPEDMIKVALTDKGVGNGMALAWQAGDQLRVIATEGGSGNEVFDIQEGFTEHSARFEGTSVTGERFTVFYPGTYAGVDAINARDYTVQTQTGNGSTAHLKWNAIESGLTDYSTVSFATRQNGALRVRLSLPDTFTTVQYIQVEAGDDVFSTTNGGGTKTNLLTLNLKTDDTTPGITLGDDKMLTAYIMVSWNDDVLPEGTTLTFKVKGEEDALWTKSKTIPEGGFTIAGGKVTNIGLNDSDWDEPLFFGGDGTAEHPYLIKTYQHLDNMRKVLSTTKIYFRLVDDIDMSGYPWTIPNSSVNNVCPIDFDGNDHTISNLSCTGQGGASLFGALYGSVYDLTIENATIASTSQAGLLSYALNNNNPAQAVIRNITVNTASVSTSSTSDWNDIGGLAGLAVNTSISGCVLNDVTISSGTHRVGGLVGRLGTAASTISGCSVSGTVTGVNYVGGMVGRNHVNSGVSITDCHVKGSTSSINGTSIIGGIIGEGGGVTEITSCSTAGTLKTPATGANEQAFVGGIAGRLNGSIKKSWSAMNLTYTTNRQKALGGLVGGSFGAITIQESYYAGGTVNGYSQLGGIVGQCGHNLVLENSYSAGTLIAYAGYTGALVGYVSAAVTVNINNCYSSMAVSNSNSGSNNALGGLIGGSDQKATTWTVAQLLAWNNSISFRTSTDSEGVIVGQIHPSGGTGSTSFTNCWYRNDLSYTKAATARTPGNDEDCTTADTRRYDGKDVGKDVDGNAVTCSAKAAELGWSTDIWDLDGDLPALKNVAK